MRRGYYSSEGAKQSRRPSGWICKMIGGGANRACGKRRASSATKFKADLRRRGEHGEQWAARARPLVEEAPTKRVGVRARVHEELCALPRPPRNVGLEPVDQPVGELFLPVVPCDVLRDGTVDHRPHGDARRLRLQPADRELHLVADLGAVRRGLRDVAANSVSGSSLKHRSGSHSRQQGIRAASSPA